jgi:hypothetical protein
MPLLARRFDLAVQFASGLHHAQVRKGTQIPYVAHLMGVCAIVLESGGDEDQAIGALMHDAMEDQGGLPTLETIRRLFGDRVANVVRECSDSESSDPDNKLPWHDRKKAYLEHLHAASADALLVSAADKLHNARAILADYRRIGDEVWLRFNKETSKADQLRYYRALVNTFRQTSAPVALIDEIDRIVTELESSITGSDKAAEAKQFLEGFEQYLSARLRSEFPNEEAFNDYVVQKLNEYLSSEELQMLLPQAWLKPQDARQAVLSESYRRLIAFASDSPARTKPHPFTKTADFDPTNVWSEWQSGNRKSPALIQSCPDMALRAPFPHRIVIEGKYFRNKSVPAAGAALVAAIYECFFYRGLPEVSTQKKRAAWGYDYAWLVAFDSTGYARSAWQQIDQRVRDAFWDTARICVLIVPAKTD